MKKKKTKQSASLPPNPLKNLKKEIQHSILAIVFFVLAVLTILASFDLFGRVGESLFGAFYWLSGVGYFLIPAIFIMLTISFLRQEEREFNGLKTVGSLLFLVSGLGIISSLAKILEWTRDGGHIGKAVSDLSFWLFGSTATLIILSALIIISLIILFEAQLTIDTLCFWRRFRKDPADVEDNYGETKDDEIGDSLIKKMPISN